MEQWVSLEHMQGWKTRCEKRKTEIVTALEQSTDWDNHHFSENGAVESFGKRTGTEVGSNQFHLLSYKYWSKMLINLMEQNLDGVF